VSDIADQINQGIETEVCQLSEKIKALLKLQIQNFMYNKKKKVRICG
jgi:hypothetical protein